MLLLVTHPPKRSEKRHPDLQTQATQSPNKALSLSPTIWEKSACVVPMEMCVYDWVYVGVGVCMWVCERRIKNTQVYLLIIF